MWAIRRKRSPSLSLYVPVPLSLFLENGERANAPGLANMHRVASFHVPRSPAFPFFRRCSAHTWMLHRPPADISTVKSESSLSRLSARAAIFKPNETRRSRTGDRARRRGASKNDDNKIPRMRTSVARRASQLAVLFLVPIILYDERERNTSKE